MALTKEKKRQVIDEVGQLLATSKMTVVTKYRGTTVKALQDLRREARADGTTVKVFKNRLVKKALEQSSDLSKVNSAALEGMLLYAFNADDEVAPAQVIANFAKLNPTLEFVGAITADGQFISADDVKSLAALPSKEQLRGMLVGTLAAPLTGFVSVMSGNTRAILNVLNARSQQLEA